MNPIAFLVFVLGINITNPKRLPPPPAAGTQTLQQPGADRPEKQPPVIMRGPGSGDKN